MIAPTDIDKWILDRVSALKPASEESVKTCPLYPVRPKPANGITRELNALENPKNDRFTASFDSAGGVA
jgi:hypothetical protein